MTKMCGIDGGKRERERERERERVKGGYEEVAEPNNLKLYKL